MKRIVFSLLAALSAVTAFGQGIPYILNKGGRGTNAVFRGSNYVDSVVSTNVATTNLSASKIDMVGTGSPTVSSTSGVQFAVPSVNATGTVSAANVRSSLAGSTNVPTIVSPSDFGVLDLTGATDMTALLNTTIASCPLGNPYTSNAGWIVTLPSGTIRLDGTVNLKPGVKIRGQGVWSTRLLGCDSTGTRPMFYANADSFVGQAVGVYYFGFEDLMLQAASNYTASAAIWLVGTNEYITPEINRVFLYGPFWDGVFLKNTIQGVVLLPKVQGMQNDGIVFWEDNNAVTLISPYCIVNRGYGICARGSRNNQITILGGAADINVRGGMLLEGRNFIVAGAHTENNSGVGITCSNLISSKIEGAYVQGSASSNSVFGILIDGGYEIEVGYNSIFPNSPDGATNGWCIAATNTAGAYPQRVEIHGGDFVSWGLGTVRDTSTFKVVDQGVGYRVNNNVGIYTDAGTNNLAIAELSTDHATVKVGTGDSQKQVYFGVAATSGFLDGAGGAFIAIPDGYGTMPFAIMIQGKTNLYANGLGYVGIAGVNPTNALTVNGNLSVFGTLYPGSISYDNTLSVGPTAGGFKAEANVQALATLIAHSDTVYYPPATEYKRSKGTAASPTAPNTYGDWIGMQTYYAWGTNGAWKYSAGELVSLDAAQQSDGAPTRFDWYTTKIGESAPAARMSLENNGRLSSVGGWAGDLNAGTNINGANIAKTTSYLLSIAASNIVGGAAGGQVPDTMVFLSNVGVKTNPQVALHIVGTTLVEGSDARVLKLNGASSDYLSFATGGTEQSLIGSDGPTIPFGIYQTGWRLAVKDGLVGINTTTPQTSLDVEGKISGGTSNSTVPAVYSKGTNNMVLRCPDGGTWILRVSDSGTLSAATNSTGL